MKFSTSISTGLTLVAAASALPLSSTRAPCECSPIDESSSVYMSDFLLALQSNGYLWDVAAHSLDSEHHFEYKGVNTEGKNFTAITTVQFNEPVEGGLSVSDKLYECFKNSEKTPGWNSNVLIAPKCALYADNKLVASMEIATNHIETTSTKAAPTTTSHEESTSAQAAPTTAQVKPITTSAAPSSTHVKSVSTKAETSSTTVSVRATPTATPKPTVHAPCECSPIDEAYPILMGDFIMDYHNAGYLWNSASRSTKSEHRYEFKGHNDFGVDYTAVITIQPNEPVEGDLPLSSKLYECFMSTETTPSWSYNAVIAPKCSLYADNKLLASMEITSSQ
ncbi:hypothetical protein K493DRAFT_354595 [Basidiobolus meristosporus CBS 931.73]|uniref:Uncharacterized protein n=1 Tax=Basidiobolus meristosporus CBS 931.73 TaxID=1314790 RepID=A0A1Y1Y445_9FUNG|nr:hypothetical protein K493DRAFT_354595 [Basidiobolus meristosporus CBS 931.73]|eukprot:ORX92354.1 hypothetical protein K493DRAFT_354595 [Basidiobolus meristosporus CBS 931.73]